MSELPPDVPTPAPLSPTVRWLLLLLAALSLVLAVIGFFLPVIPTVPFVLLAAWAATRSSPRLARWLENHKLLGPPLRDWRHGGVVQRRAKWLATGMMSASVTGLLVVLGPIWPVAAIAAVLAAVAVWLWRRPERAP